jgi:hypothetical protein
MVDDGHVLGQQLAIFDQPGAELVHHLQRLQVITADFIGHVTGTAENAFKNDVLHFLGVFALFVQERKRHGEPAARRVRIEIVVGYAGAAFGEPAALYLVERNKLAVRALAASFHIGSKIF